MNFSSWLSYVEELAETRGLDIHDVREALILCGKPSRPALPFDKSALTNRLTDPSRLDNQSNILIISWCDVVGCEYD